MKKHWLTLAAVVAVAAVAFALYGVYANVSAWVKAALIAAASVLAITLTGGLALPFWLWLTCIFVFGYFGQWVYNWIPNVPPSAYGWIPRQNPVSNTTDMSASSADDNG
jgi:hypothetical protein